MAVKKKSKAPVKKKAIKKKVVKRVIIDITDDVMLALQKKPRKTPKKRYSESQIALWNKVQKNLKRTFTIEKISSVMPTTDEILQMGDLSSEMYLTKRVRLAFFTPLQREVADKAERILYKKQLYSVYLEQMPTDSQITSVGVPAAVKRVVAQTNYWNSIFSTVGGRKKS